MKNLSGLTSKIRQWNLMGYSMLPTLEFAIIHSAIYDKEVVDFLEALGPTELLYDEKADHRKASSHIKTQEIVQQQSLSSAQEIQYKSQIETLQQPLQTQKALPTQENQQSQQNAQNQSQKTIVTSHAENAKQNVTVEQKQYIQQSLPIEIQNVVPIKKSLLEEWDLKLSQSIYAIYLINQKIEARVHLIIDQQIGGKIDDQTLKITKKIIQRLKRNKNIIFLNFNSSVYKLDLMSDHLEQFGLSFKTKERQIKVDHIIFKANTSKNKREQRNRSKIQKADTKVFVINKKQQSQNDPTSVSIEKLSGLENVQNSEAKKPSELIPFPKLIVKVQPKLQIAEKIDPLFKTNVRQKLNQLFSENPINLTEILINQIEKKYLSIFGVDINRNFTEMKAYHKQILYELKRYQEIIEFIQKDRMMQESLSKVTDSWELSEGLQANKKEKNLTSYGLNCLQQAKQYLVSSLWGTYSSIKVYREPTMSNQSKSKKRFIISDRRSLHWQIMEIMNEIWDIEGDFLMKQLDKMPLTYIQERYKMLDYQTIGGFMPSSCFEAIFAGPLKKMVQHIIETLEIVQMKIVNQVKTVVEYFFAMTNLSDELADIQAQEIKMICSKFRFQAQKVLKSQIQFISVSHEDFWSFKQIKSSLYGPQQQAYIEIKYIGKNYTKKVFDNIRETLPRLIGQNLLREIVSWLDTRSVQIFMALMFEKGLKIQITPRELDWIQGMKITQKKVDQLIYYFSLKTSSETGVKHLHENIQKNWNRMFRNPTKRQKAQEKEPQIQRKGGFFEWAKKLLKRNKQSEKKRSSSQQKQIKIQQPHQRQSNSLTQPKKQQTLTQKNWLLIININKEVEEQKIQRSSEQGFPQRLRPSIWYYLAKRQISESVKKVHAFLNEGANVKTNEEKTQLADVFKQIDKDVNRTPPPNLFRKGYLGSTLTRVLQAYSIYDKELRYTQGMNFIVGIILCVLTHHGENCEYAEERVKSKAFFEVLENQCFLIFMYLMERKGLRKIMFIERTTITDLCVRLEDYIKKKSLLMHQKIERSGFNVQVIFSGALISGLTTSQIEFRLQKRVVDLLLAHEFNILYKIIGQFVSTAESLCGNMENENLYYFLKGTVYNDVYKHIGDEGLCKMFHSL